MDHVQISLPGKVVAWLSDNDITLVEDGHRPGEREWRQALATATPRRVGRGTVVDLKVSGGAAVELAGELEERAETEAGLPSGERLIQPGLVVKAAQGIRAALKS